MMPKSDAQPSVGRCALVADDDATMRDVLRSLLAGEGYTVLLASSGREALTLASNLEATIAIIDLSMPNGNGLETCIALRQMANWREVPILVLTHHHTDKAISAARRAGATGFVAKPFTPAELLRHIEYHTRAPSVAKSASPTHGVHHPHVPTNSTECGQNSALSAQSELIERHAHTTLFDQQQAVLQVYRNAGNSSEASSLATANHNRRPRILVGDASEQARNVLTHTLETEGCVVENAIDGREALSMFIRGRYDLVLMNARLPVMGAIEVAYTIRSMEGIKAKTPIVVLVEKADRLFLRDLKDAGINGYLLSTAKAEALLSCLQRYLPEEVIDRLAAQPADARLAPDLETLSRVAALFPPGAMVGFLGKLAASVEETLAMLDDGWMVAEPTELLRRLHSLAGTAGTLGCGTLSTAARDLQADPSSQQRFVETARATLRAIRTYFRCDAFSV